MAQECSRRLLIAEARLRSHASLGWSCSRRMALGQVSLRELRFSPVNIIASVFHAHSFVVHRLKIIATLDIVVKLHTKKDLTFEGMIISIKYQKLAFFCFQHESFFHVRSGWPKLHCPVGLYCRRIPPVGSQESFFRNLFILVAFSMFIVITAQRILMFN